MISSNALIIAQKYEDEEISSVAAGHLMMTTRNNDDILMLARCYDEMLPLWWWRVCACHWQFGAARASWWSAECSRKCRRPGSTASTSTSTSPPPTPGLLSPKVHLRSHHLHLVATLLSWLPCTLPACLSCCSAPARFCQTEVWGRTTYGAPQYQLTRDINTHCNFKHPL